MRLFLVVLVVGVVVGPSWAEETVLSKEEAIKKIEAMGGSVFLSEKRAGRPPFQVFFQGAKFTDDDLKLLSNWTDLEVLVVTHAQITAKGLLHLQRLTKLEILVILDCRITDKGLAHLKRATNLKVIHLEGTKVTHKGIRELKKALPSVVVFR
jgi:hypothetical protein